MWAGCGSCWCQQITPRSPNILFLARAGRGRQGGQSYFFSAALSRSFANTLHCLLPDSPSYLLPQVPPQRALKALNPRPSVSGTLLGAPPRHPLARHYPCAQPARRRDARPASPGDEELDRRFDQECDFREGPSSTQTVARACPARDAESALRTAGRRRGGE